MNEIYIFQLLQQELKFFFIWFFFINIINTYMHTLIDSCLFFTYDITFLLIYIKISHLTVSLNVDWYTCFECYCYIINLLHSYVNIKEYSTLKYEKKSACPKAWQTCPSLYLFFNVKYVKCIMEITIFTVSPYN